MTEQEAYIEGFCKKAASLGYDPNSLVNYSLPSTELKKEAAWYSFIGRGLRRYFELLGGGAGRRQVLDRISGVKDHIYKLNSRYAKEKALYKNRIASLENTLKQQKAEYIAAGDPTADWTHIQNLRRQIFDLRRSGGTEEMFRLQRKIKGKKNLIRSMYKPIAGESRKVMATRLGTGLAGIGGLGLYMNGHNSEKKDFGTEDYYMDS